MKKIKLIFTFILLFAITGTYAQSKDEFKPEVKVGGTLYTGWNYNMGNSNFITTLDTTSANSSAMYGYNPKLNSFEVSQNSFFVERAYINILASLAPNVKGRITPDIVQVPGSTTAFALQLKYAWLDWTAFKKDDGLSLDFTLGIIPNRWINTAEKYWVYRGIQKTLTDYSWVTSVSTSKNATSGKTYAIATSTSSYFSSADLGLEGYLNLPKGYGELYLNVYNGNGYKDLSYDNRFKDFAANLFIHPLAGSVAKKTKASKTGRINGIADLTLGGFTYLGHLNKGENPSATTTGNTPPTTQFARNRFGGMLSAKYNFKNFGYVRIGGEFSLQSNQDAGKNISGADSTLKTTSSGLSVYLDFNPPVKEINDKLIIIARYDMFDPNTANVNASTTTFNDNTDKQSLLILGLAYKPTKVATIALSYQGTTYQQNYVTKRDGSTSKSTSRLIVHGILEF